MPGLTDREDEFNGLRALLDKTRPDMIQWRNLNYDPQRYFKKISPRSRSKLLGIRNIILDVKKEYPKLRHGYFNVPKEDQ
jgi:hypothetical protein